MECGCLHRSDHDLALVGRLPLGRRLSAGDGGDHVPLSGAVPMRSAVGWALVTIPLAVLAVAAPRKTPLASGDVRLHPCTPTERGEWAFVRNQQLGIQARARSGQEWVGRTAATDGFHDWAPFDDHKTTICGDLMVFGTFEPTREKKLLRFLPELPEHDWNIILIPTHASVFEERFRLATKLM